MIIDDILSNFYDTQSVKATAKAVGCSWQRVAKILSSSGIVINDIHCTILKMHEDGKSVQEIADQTGYSIKVIQAYLPAVRPFYNVNPSENAKTIKRHRAKKDHNKDE